MTVTDLDGKEQSAERFRIAFQKSARTRARLEITTGANPFIRVCDGISQWNYYTKSNTYIKILLPQFSSCAYPITKMGLLNLLQSSVVAGNERVLFEDRQRECKVLRGQVAPTFPSQTTRTFAACVEPSTKLILRYQIEGEPTSGRKTIFTFTSIRRNPQLDSSLFQFSPPDGSKEIGVISWLDPMARPTKSAVQASNEYFPPNLVSIVAPERTREASSKTIQGTVVFHVEIQTDGKPSSVQVIQSLGTGLDENAAKAVRQWRFSPTVKPLVTVIGVNFQGP